MAYNSNYGGNQSYGGGGQNYGQQNAYGGAQYTSYGAQGGADGGGFLGGSQGGSQGGGGGKAYGKDTLRPCTILQVLSASQPHPDADFSLDDVEITQITFVGQIRNISQQTTNMTYKLDDGTGSIEVKQWIDSDAPKYDEHGDPVRSRKPELKVGEWARCWGRLKAFNNRRHVGAHVIRPVQDKNEINYHLLEATFAHLYFTRGPPEQFSAAGGAENVADGQQAQQQQQNGYSNGGGEAHRSLPPQLSSLARRIVQCLKTTPQNNEGLHMQQIAAATGMGVAEVMKGGDELLQQSLIFTTVDDNTWALLEM
ncbi:replication factor A protein 2 [Xylographa parallela]|nr:replication factor A protein 2 [Xylographa parallela]